MCQLVVSHNIVKIKWKTKRGNEQELEHRTNNRAIETLNWKGYMKNKIKLVEKNAQEFAKTFRG
jgi:hypothetical protein